MNFLPEAHLIQGPLDAFIELVLPLLILGGLWWWSSRAEKRNKKDSDKTE